MTDLEKAARMALEALEQLQGGCTDSNDGTVEAITVWCPEVIAALRQALEQPAQQEPVAWVREHELPLAPGDAFSWVETFAHKTPLYKSPQRKPWVGLTPRERIMCRSYDPEEAVAKTEAKLKEKNA